MSSRPVPRRESPWGLPEGDTRQPQAHRCNDRAEDVIQMTESMYFTGHPDAGRSREGFVPHKQACFEGNPFETVPGPFKLFWQCMRSKPGEEPTQPYYYLKLDPPKREETKLE